MYRFDVRTQPSCGKVPALAMLVGAVLVSATWSQEPEPANSPESEKAAPTAPAGLSAKCRDGSTLQIIPRDERLELVTPYGKLQVPVRVVQRIEVATRIPEAKQRQVEAAIASLGKPEFAARDAAVAQLLQLGEYAYPALLKAAKDGDREVSRRANSLIEKIKAAVPAERLVERSSDIVHTSDSKIAGRLTATSLRVSTGPFGDQDLKLSDLLEVAARAKEEPENDEGVLPDPGPMHQYQGMVGKTLRFRVTGGGGQAMVNPLGGIFGGGGGAVWGTDVYTLDSSLALAAVHAGVIKAGQTAVVKVAIVGPQNNFTASARNGIVSGPWGFYPGAFKFIK